MIGTVPLNKQQHWRIGPSRPSEAKAANSFGTEPPAASRKRKSQPEAPRATARWPPRLRERQTLRRLKITFSAPATRNAS